MLKILIADASEMFCDALTEQLQSKFVVKSCQNGNRALELIYSFEPDLLVLDMSLPGMDGIGVLRTIQAAGRHPQVLATTSCYDTYLMHSFEQLSVSYILSKPCTVSAVVSRIYEMIVMQRKAEWNADDEANSLLLSLGLRMSLGGYRCVHEALLVMMRDTTQPITKEVYPLVANACGGSAERVERAIRSAIIDAWKNRDDRVWQLYFSRGRDGSISCPTNSDFIARIAYCLNLRKSS